MPKTIVIYAPFELKIKAIICTLNPVKCVSWHPQKLLLVITSLSGVLTLWNMDVTSVRIPSGKGFLAVQKPQTTLVGGFECSSVKWCSTGEWLSVYDRERFCLAFPIEESESAIIR